MAVSSAALVTARLRTALAGLPRTVLTSAFPATASAGDTETLTFQNIRKGFEKLGVELDVEELQDIVDVFDVNGDGRISAEEWNQWIAEEKLRGETGAGSVGGRQLEDAVQLQHQIRGILLGLEDDELKKWFQDETTGQLRVLSSEELTTILLDLSLPPSAVGAPLRALLKKMDASNDGNISFAELSAFLAQKRFAHTITNMLSRAAVKLRARGVSLPSVLLSAALRSNPRASSLLSSGDVGRVALTPANLKDVLVCQLGLPLDEAKLVALTCLADVNGNGECEIGEICSLCGESLQGVEAVEEPDILQALASPSDQAVGEEWLGSDDSKETDDWWAPLPLSSLLASPYPGMEPGARQPPVLLPATAWNDVVTSAFDAALSSAPPVAGGVASSPLSSPLSSQLPHARVLQVWAALGINMTAAAATALLQPHEVSPGMVDKPAFVRACDDALEALWRQGRLGLQRLARDRLVAALMPACLSVQNTALSAPNESYGAPDSKAFFHRSSLAAALLRHVSVVCLSPEEALAIAAHAPGLHQRETMHAFSRATGRQDEEVSVAESAATFVMRSSVASDASAFALSTPSRGAARRPSLSPRGFDEQRAAHAIAALGFTADVCLSTLMTWISTFAAGGCCVEYVSRGQNTPLCTPDACTDATLLPALRSGMRKLCSPLLAIPSLQQALQRGPLEGSVKLESQYLSCLQRLPSSFMPSCLAPLSYIDNETSLQAHMLDGGFESDPAGMYNGYAPLPSPLPTSPLPSTTVTPAAAAPAVPALTSPSVSYSVASAAGSQGPASGSLGLTLRLSSVLPGSLLASASCIPSTAATRVDAPSLRLIGSGTGTADLPWAAEGTLVRPHQLTAVVDVVSAKGVPCPADDAFRSRIVGRVLRVCLVDMAMPSEATQGQRVRLLSNVVPCHANWSPLMEDEWTIGAASASAFGRLIFRSDAPRDRGGSASCLVLFELNVQLSSHAAPLGSVAASTSGSSPPLTCRLDTYATEEVTCAWGVVPLMQLCAQGTQHRIKLVGGSPGHAAEVEAAAILQRRTQWRALAKAITGTVTTPELLITCKPLNRLSVHERQLLASLPLCAVVAFPLLEIIAICRRALAACLLSHTPSHKRSSEAHVQHAPLAILAAATRAVCTQGGAPTAAWSTLAKALHDDLARATKHKPTQKEEDVLFQVLLRIWPAVTLSGAGFPLGPAASMESVTSDLCSRYLSGAPAVASTSAGAATITSLCDATLSFKAYDPVEMCY